MIGNPRAVYALADTDSVLTRMSKTAPYQLQNESLILAPSKKPRFDVTMSVMWFYSNRFTRLMEEFLSTPDPSLIMVNDRSARAQKGVLTICIAPVGLVIGERQAWLVETKEKRYDINEERKYLITPPRVLGWSTIRKSWCEFMVNEVKAARVANHAIFENELQLDENGKKMIRALVEQHNSKGAMNDVRNPDLIEGKGRGLVILLHGRFSRLSNPVRMLTFRRSPWSWENGQFPTFSLLLCG